MLAEYNQAPDDRMIYIHMEKCSTKCKANHVLVEPDNLQYFRNKNKNLQTIMKWIDIMIYNQKSRKGLISGMKKEIEHIFKSTDIYLLQEYFQTIAKDSQFNGFHCEYRMSLFCLIAYHEMATSEKENSTQILNVIQQRFDFHFLSLHTIYIYLDMYYKGKQDQMFTYIHTIWKSDPATELCLKLVCCKRLTSAEDYKTLIQLIHHDADYFRENLEKINLNRCVMPMTIITVILHILHYQVSINKMENVKTFKKILSKIHDKFPDESLKAFNNYILTLDNKQILYTPYVVKIIQHVLTEDLFDSLEFILSCSNRLRKAKHFTECNMFIKSHSKLILCLPTNKLNIQRKCNGRQQYCILLLLLLNIYLSSNDIHEMNIVINRLLKFRVNFLSSVYVNSNSCYCFMGIQKCFTKEKKSQYPFESRSVFSRSNLNFKEDLLDSYLIKVNSYSTFTMHAMLWLNEIHKYLYDFNTVMIKVIHGNMELAPYVQSIIGMMSMHEYEDESFSFFMEFIKMSAAYNAALLYDIIKILCALNLPSKVHDMVLQGLIAYVMISCNRQYGLLPKFILDINMICPQGQFLQNLTSSIAWLKIDNNTASDFMKMIYHCYCTVRHGSKMEKNANIEKYRRHFAFIVSMEVGEEMKKLTALTNLLLMLSLLLIASGGHHKSAKLKKYLSLKYEYRDSILYLLWCCGDVEINPGPTLGTLTKVSESVKERNWLYEMCSILVRLLKYNSIDLKNNGLWKEKPLKWPTDWPFYDIRNKPKHQGYNTETDKELLAHLVEYCNKEEVFKNMKHDKDKHKKLQLKQYQKEITAWQSNKTELFELYTFRKILDTLKAVKGSLYKYRNDSELQNCLNDLDLDLIFYSFEVSNVTNQGYTDILRDIAITLCRTAKGFNLLAKSDGIWKTEPNEWNPHHPYYSPCNAGKKKVKGQFQELVNNLLIYCESKNITTPIELQPLIKAWKQGKTSEITKSYTIWSKTAILNHSLKNLELDGMLEKIHVQESLAHMGVILDTQCSRWPIVKKSFTCYNDDQSQDSGFSDNKDSSGIETTSTASLQISTDNQYMQLLHSTNDIPLSSHSLVSHIDGDLCNITSDQQHQWNQSSKHTCVNSFEDNCQIFSSKAHSETDGQHQPISFVNSSNSNEQLVPCIVHIHDSTSKPEIKNNKISKTTKVSKIIITSIINIY